ncbi:FAD-binding oxidoreductase [Nonomuraea sp. NPDC050536]|uniref:FAD-binding oxidoreductase n=1 Tax=Nonomuraea sp. NPDC050536 TaxID=3364366 RepID=UPI0037CBFDB6
MGLAVTAQAGGHGASGDVDGVILLRTKALDSVTVWPDKRVARVGAGAPWGKVLAEAGPHGLAGLAGSSPIVSVVGYTLGGGLSWFGRKYGWAADSVRAPEEGAEATRILDGIGGAIADERGPVAVADLGDITSEPTDPGPGMGRAELLTGLDDATAETLLAAPIDPLVGVQVRHLGGALAEPGGGPTGPVAEPYLLYMLGLALNPQLAQAVRGKQAELTGALGAVVSGRKPYTFLSPGEQATAAFPAETIARLRAIRQAANPHGVIRANYSV